MDEIYEGGCFCGRIHYRMHGQPMFIHCCHCTDCQRQTGGAFAINALIEAERIEIIKDEPVAVTMPTDSGHPHDIYRCPQCQTALWSDYGRRGWMLFIRVSTLERRAEFFPDVRIFTRSKVPWVRLPEDAQIFDEYYSTKALCPLKALHGARQPG
ncbi:GFA family protein [Neorhizobium alkalisoli]|uniref:GFA family protein n=1 Tax=Neorhizobium alkalisoli TaxID=528178 RepID=UPI000CF9F784|nr:GFA family protein [Neorhizobium alkalisoli]